MVAIVTTTPSSFHSVLEQINGMDEIEARDKTIGEDGGLTDRKKGFLESFFANTWLRSWFTPSIEGSKLRLSKDLAKHYKVSLQNSGLSRVSEVVSQASCFEDVFFANQRIAQEKSYQIFSELEIGEPIPRAYAGFNSHTILMTISLGQEDIKLPKLEELLSKHEKIKAWIEENKHSPYGRLAIKKFIRIFEPLVHKQALRYTHQGSNRSGKEQDKKIIRELISVLAKFNEDLENFQKLQVYRKPLGYPETNTS